MATEPLVLRGLAWDHQRGIGAARSVAEAYAQQRDDVRVVWDNRPKMMFAYMPLEEMFGKYDLVLFDHPTIGRTVNSVPPMACLDELVDAEWLSGLQANSIGPTYESYTLQGRQWAVPVDAAAVVALSRPDLVPDDIPIPKSWGDIAPFVRALERVGVRMGLPMNYSDCAANLDTIGYQLVGMDFFSPDTGYMVDALRETLALLDSLVRLADRRTLELEPLDAMELMASGSNVGYMPLQFGYVNYCWDGFRKSRLRFMDPPSSTGDVQGSVLGGVGLGISRTTAHPVEAAEFLRFMAGDDCQLGPLFEGGGQPSSRKAWYEARLDERTDGFFSRTRTTLENAFVRPRVGDCAWFFEQQVAVGHIMAKAVAKGEPLQPLADDIVRIDRAMALETTRS